MQYVLPLNPGESRFAVHIVNQARGRTALVVAGSGGATIATVERVNKEAVAAVELTQDRIRKGVTLLVASLTPLS